MDIPTRTLTLSVTDVQNLLDDFHIDTKEIPVMICQGKFVLRNPSNQKITECLGFNKCNFIFISSAIAL